MNESRVFVKENRQSIISITKTRNLLKLNMNLKKKSLRTGVLLKYLRA